MLDSEHLGDDAELYAIGSLTDIERARVERHVRVCPQCAKRVGQAEATVLHLIDDVAEQPVLERRPPVVATRTPGWISAVIAAAFVAGLVPWGVSALHQRSEGNAAQSTEQTVSSAMLAGHFAHAPFVARVPGAPAAKVLYAREGGWLYVIAGPGAATVDVAVIRGSRSQTVATLEPSDRTRSSFIANTGRVTRVDLVEHGTSISSATLYPIRTVRPQPARELRKNASPP